MNYLQEQEARDYDNAYHDRFDGFDRGDADWDYEAERLAQNEADEIELRAAGLID
ncbi:MAG TPA: hypothetical protein P5305_04030 [Rubrivivax sp.]|nr:hypothetical protein [Rubrivivax sp.]HRY87031.1 hypothetical protein [Rubrivivax sp.]